MRGIFIGYFLLGLVACGGDPPVVPPANPALIPMGLGHHWTYRVTSSDGQVTVKEQTVTGTVASSRGTAFVVLTEKRNSKGTRAVQVVEEGRLLRLSEETLEGTLVEARLQFEPYDLRIDSSKINLGDTYEDAHQENVLDASGNILETLPIRQVFTVEATGELVSVPAGTFECVKIRRKDEDGGEKLFWYAPGLGKVKEAGGQTEELVRADIPAS